MDLKLKGQMALVTGSTSGIGKAIASNLLREGAKVVINSFSKEELDSVREEMSALGEAYFMQADVTSTESVNSMIEEIEKIAPLDIVVNNVGFWKASDFAELTDEAWSRTFDLNLNGHMRVCRAVLPKMLERNYGRIINISSECALKPLFDFVDYSTAKTAVLGLTRALAEITKGTKVTVNAVLPGPALTPGEKRSQEEEAEANGRTFEEQVKYFFSTYEPTSLIQRHVLPQEIADVVTFYCSPLTSAVTGTPIRVDGGIVRHI